MIHELDHYWNVRDKPTLYKYVEPEVANSDFIKMGFKVSVLATAMLLFLVILFGVIV